MSTGILRVSTTAVAQNWTRIQRRVGSAVRVGGVVKANAYGLGVAPVSAALYKAGCRDFFVVTLEEGIEARRALAAVADAAAQAAPSPQERDACVPRIVIMGGVDLARPESYIEHGLTPAVNSLPQLRSFRAAAARHESKGYPAKLGIASRVEIFLQVDSGMTRLGLDARERDAFVADVDGHLGPDLRLAYVMSHLACSDDAATTFTEMQRTNFESFVSELRAAAPPAQKDFKCTLGNSVGTFREPGVHYDLVRPGMSLYGLKPNTWGGEGADVEAPSPVLRTVELTAPVVQVRQAEKGSQVSYGARFTCERDSCIGVVGIGYADGFHRAIGHKGAALYWDPSTATMAAAAVSGCGDDRSASPSSSAAGTSAPTIPADETTVNAEPVSIEGSATAALTGSGVYRLPILGTVCMDSCMVDLTDVPPELRPAEGAQLEVIGAHQPPDQLANFAGTIGYEVLTSLGRRFRRVYEGEGAVLPLQ